MTNKDRKIQFFLQIFYLVVGIYILADNISALTSGRGPSDIFDFYQQDIPVFDFAVGFISALACLITSFVLWNRVSWSHGFAIFTSGLLLCYNLEAMGRAIYRNPNEAIPMVIILIVVLQSFPFLVRQTDRHL